jgi:cysteine-rich repeat protein
VPVRLEAMRWSICLVLLLAGRGARRVALMPAFVVLALALGGCIQPNSVTCPDGVVCAEGYLCDVAHHSCVTPQQSTACEDLDDGDLCHFDDRDGRCDLGACLATCGDGVRDDDAGEQCDDGNYTSHDGCSSACLIETITWRQWVNPWQARQWHAAAYDSDRDRLVVFGGYHNGFLADTWERRELGNGSTWSRVATASAPSPRQTVMAYDAKRHVVVLFGGRDYSSYDDTWEYDGTTWTHVMSTTRPSARNFHSMVWDAKREKIVLFGGLATTLVGDTWTYDGTWTQIASTGPSPRAGAALAYDPVRETVVLFGGTGASNETWELPSTSSTWTKASPPSSPPGRARPAMAFSALRGAIVMFGGSGSGITYGDTWEYRSSGWSQLDTAAQPQGAADHTLTAVADAVANGGEKLVLVGGVTSTGSTDRIWELPGTSNVWTVLEATVTPNSHSLTQAVVDGSGDLLTFALDREMWAFDGSAWSVRTSTGIPPGVRSSPVIAYDTVRGDVVVAGGLQPATSVNALVYGDSFRWHAGQWELVDEAKPGGRYAATAVYDSARGVVVLFGGNQNNTNRGDTWELDSTGWRQTSSGGGPNEPTAAVYPSMAYDPITRRAILLDWSGDTYAYDGTWQKLDVPRMSLALRGGTMTFDPWRRRLVLFGGFDANATLYNDVYELADGGWTAVEVTGERPSARFGDAFVAHPRSRALVLVGGTDLMTYPGDTWFLEYRSDTPDEDCANGQDDDGDARADVADPDCTLL